MRLLLVTAGSRGDVEPFMALARRATAVGHEVLVAAPDRSGVMAEGVAMTSLGVDYTAMIEEQGVSVAAAVRNYRTVVKPVMRNVIVGAARAALDFEPDVIVSHPRSSRRPSSRRGSTSPMSLSSSCQRSRPRVRSLRRAPLPSTWDGSTGSRTSLRRVHRRCSAPLSTRRPVCSTSGDVDA